MELLIRLFTAAEAEGAKFGDCPDFRVNENGTVPFRPVLAVMDCTDTKILTGPNS
jgi:hypothetical protein